MIQTNEKSGMSIGGGFQIATTQFHRNNHNRIFTVRFRSKGAEDSIAGASAALTASWEGRIIYAHGVPAKPSRSNGSHLCIRSGVSKPISRPSGLQFDSS